ncbi:hypothetical protein A2U01_0067775 [Trifolium medium]|uniref:Uncharacterized protein n=1 Tax=Trifolium medium TaxID=97028 RepID=A0A392SF50_9FABA|nr:hypothetical protein [Trifolium medium]
MEKISEEEEECVPKSEFISVFTSWRRGAVSCAGARPSRFKQLFWISPGAGVPFSCAEARQSASNPTFWASSGAWAPYLSSLP